LAIKLLAGFLLSLGRLGGLLYFLLQNALEARFAKKLEETKHDLQLDLEKMSIVYRHQKDSFFARFWRASLTQ